MEGLTQVLEKISTLNINANTNVDIQGIVQNYVLFDTVKNIGVAFVIGAVILTIAFMCYRFAVRSLTLKEREKGIKEREEILKKMEEVAHSFKDYRELENLMRKVDEVIKYMPRNKKPRSTNN